MIEFGDQLSSIEYSERPGSYGIAISGNKILVEMAKLGYFLPGGGIDEGETIEEALRREFREESGYEISSFQTLGSAAEYVNLPDEDFYIKKVGHFFLVELGEKGEPTYDDGHVFPVEWRDIEEIRANLYLKSQWWSIEQALAQST
jgi:8-oxo-dGTP diphosphatase